MRWNDDYWGIKKKKIKFEKPPISQREKREYEKVLFPKSSVSINDIKEEEVRRKAKEVKQKVKRLRESGASKETIIKTIKKGWREGYELIKKEYPKERKSLEKMQRESERMFDIKLRLQELLDIGAERSYTRKETEELERLGNEIHKIAEG